MTSQSRWLWNHLHVWEHCSGVTHKWEYVCGLYSVALLSSNWNYSGYMGSHIQLNPTFHAIKNNISLWLRGSRRKSTQCPLSPWYGGAKKAVLEYNLQKVSSQNTRHEMHLPQVRMFMWTIHLKELQLLPSNFILLKVVYKSSLIKHISFLWSFPF